MPSDPLLSALIGAYENRGERDLIRAFLELHISDDDLWHAFNVEKLKEVLHEPRREEDLKRPVKNYLRDEWGLVGVAAEVPLGPKASRNATKADIVGYKTVFLGRTQFYGVELKSAPTKGAIRQAFAQAKEYQQYCDFAAACFSPLVYMNYLDELDKEIKEPQYRGVGVWVANSEKVLYELRKASLTNVTRKNQEGLVDRIKERQY